MDSKNLTIRIEILRKEMISSGLSKGFTSPDTLKLSETLDQLINFQIKIKEVRKFESNCY